MWLNIDINDEPERIQDVRTLEFRFDDNIIRFHLNNAAQDYIDREITSTGFPGGSIVVTITPQA